MTVSGAMSVEGRNPVLNPSSANLSLPVGPRRSAPRGRSQGKAHQPSCRVFRPVNASKIARPPPAPAWRSVATLAVAKGTRKPSRPLDHVGAEG
jgi:hypothetical protein